VEVIKIKIQLDFKSQEGVKLNEKLYKDKTYVEAEKEAVLKRLEDKGQDIKKQIEELNKQLTTLTENENKELFKYTEILEVFKL
jgi:hypothetical protein